ncbi:MAG: peptidylprolyl isomerase, partial [Thermoproteota archaeon]
MKKILIIISLSLLLISLGNQSFAQSDDVLVILHTNLGKIVIELFPNDAPNHVVNFIKLSENGFYDGTIFHRIIPGFMIQGGDPNTKDKDQSTWGSGGPG